MPGGGLLSIRTGGTATTAELQVQDHGAGMPPDVAQRAVEPFFTTKPKGTGTGLGLSMVNGFVGQSGGRMIIDSKLGQGTTVTLRFPLRAAAPERTGATA
jgi:signal transduction histidine kinase